MFTPGLHKFSPRHADIAADLHEDKPSIKNFIKANLATARICVCAGQNVYYNYCEYLCRRLLL